MVDDHRPMLEYAALMLRSEFTVAALMRDMESLLDGWVEARPDVVVLDVSLRPGSGYEAAVRLRAAGCRAPVVFLSVHQEADFVRAAWDAGALGYVAKRDIGRALVPAIRAALRGRRYLSAAVASS
jgi:DNA-binding NarL/FixJ family response regulator